LAFHIQIDKDVVRRILGHHYRPGQPSGGPQGFRFWQGPRSPEALSDSGRTARRAWGRQRYCRFSCSE
jgi:hypothetical protein